MIAKARAGLEGAVRAVGWSLIKAFRRPIASRHANHDPRSLAVLIQSFDRYKRFWRPVAHFTSANLPSGFPIYFASEDEPFLQHDITPILTGRGAFGDRMRRAIKHIEKIGFRYVLYLQEDMWISEPIDADRLEDILDLMKTHDLDALKLADLAEPPPQIDELGRNCTRLGSKGLGAHVRWFGSHDYVFSHHTTIFKTSFLMEVLMAASLFRRVRPLQQEQFCSAYLKWRSVATEGDGGHYRVATFAGEPLLHYVHASEMGRLTDEAAGLLNTHGLTYLYDPDIPGEFFPNRRSGIQ